MTKIAYSFIEGSIYGAITGAVLYFLAYHSAKKGG